MFLVRVHIKNTNRYTQKNKNKVINKNVAEPWQNQVLIFDQFKFVVMYNIQIKFTFIHTFQNLILDEKSYKINKCIYV